MSYGTVNQDIYNERLPIGGGSMEAARRYIVTFNGEFDALNIPMIPVISVAALRAVISEFFVDAQIANILGGTEFYEWNSASAAADDGFLVIKSNDVVGNGRWLRKSDFSAFAAYEQSVGVFRPSGLYGDGPTHDDTAALQAAINACPAGAALMIPTPTTYYKCSAALTIPVSGLRIIGNGPIPSRIHQSHAAADLFTTGANPVSGLQFENLWLTGQGPGSGVGINLISDQTYGTHHVLRDVRFGGSGAILGFGTGLKVSHCMAPMVQGCQFWQNGVGLEMLGAPNSAVVIGCEFAANFRGLRLKNSTLLGTIFPVVGTNVIGNIFQSNSWESVTIENCNGNIIQGNYFEAGGAYLGAGESVYDIIIDDGLAGAGALNYGNIIWGNSFRGSNSATPPYLGAVHVVNGYSHVLARNVHTANSHIVIEAAAVSCEIDRSTRIGAVTLTDNGAGTVVAPAFTRGAARPTVNLHVGDMHYDTDLATPRVLWIASLGPTVWIDGAGTVVA